MQASSKYNQPLLTRFVGVRFMPFKTPKVYSDYMKKYREIQQLREKRVITKGEFLETLRDIVFNKFQNRCSVCHIDVAEVLSIHHINGNHKDNRIENLQLVCFNCHHLIEMYPDAIAKVPDYDALRKDIDYDLLQKLQSAIANNSHSKQECIYHEGRKADVVIGYDIKTGKTLPLNQYYGVCEECWKVLTDLPLPVKTQT